MFRRFFSRRQAPAPSWIASVPDSVVLYAIGDIHGRRDLMLEVLDQIATDAA